MKWNVVFQSQFCVTGGYYEAVDGRPLSVTNKSSQAPQGICFISGTQSSKMASGCHLLPPGWLLRAGTSRHAGPQQGIGEVGKKSYLPKLLLLFFAIAYFFSLVVVPYLGLNSSAQPYLHTQMGNRTDSLTLAWLLTQHRCLTLLNLGSSQLLCRNSWPI